MSAISDKLSGGQLRKVTAGAPMSALHERNPDPADAACSNSGRFSRPAERLTASLTRAPSPARADDGTVQVR